MTTRARRNAGYTMIEIAIATGLALAVLGALGSLVGSTQELTKENRTHARASEVHGRNLRALSNVLRCVDIRTLTGFNPDGVATTPVFKRVLGADLTDRSYDGSERIEWRAAAQPVWNVARPGDLFLVSAAGATRIAANIPFDGFQVRQEGNTLAIRLTTYYSLGAQRTFRVTSETAVSLRN